MILIEHGETFRVSVLFNGDGADVSDFSMISGGAYRALFGLKNVDADFGAVGQQGSPPTPRTEGADWRQRQQWRVERQDWSVCGEVVGGAAGWRRQENAVADKLFQPYTLIDT